MSDPVADKKNGDYFSSSSSSEDEGNRSCAEDGFRKDGEPEYKPRKASSSDSDSSADGADDIEDTSESREISAPRKRSTKSDPSGNDKSKSSSDTDEEADDISEDPDDEDDDDDDVKKKKKLEEEKKLDILNDNQELSKEEMELSKRQTVAMDEKVEFAPTKEVTVEEKKEDARKMEEEHAEESNPVTKDPIPSIEIEDEAVKMEAPTSSSDEEEVAPEQPILSKKTSISSAEEAEIPMSIPKSRSIPLSSSDEEEKEMVEREKSISSSEDDKSVKITHMRASSSSSSENEEALNEEPAFVSPEIPREKQEEVISKLSAPLESETVSTRSESPEKTTPSPKPPTSPKPSHVPKVNAHNNNGDITKIYTGAINHNNTDAENNNKNMNGAHNRPKPARDITEIYKNTILAKESTPPASPRTPRSKPAKDITSLYTDKIEKPNSTAPAEKFCPKKHNMATNVEKDDIRRAYEDVRSDTTDTEWAVFKFEGNKLGVTATGNDFQEFKSCFGNEDRGFGYIRIKTGDEMSKRSKFVLVTWVGPQVSVMKKAKMSTDKALMKDVIQNLSVELQLESHFEFNHDHFKHEVDRASGARYGTGVRDL